MTEDLLLDAARSGLFYLSAERKGAFAAAADKAGLSLLAADAGPSTERESILREIGGALHFPEWYGANFDALYDCLTDPDWYPARGHALLLSGLDKLRRAAPESFATLVEVLESAAQTRREAGQPFWVLIDTAAPGIPPAP